MSLRALSIIALGVVLPSFAAAGSDLTEIVVREARFGPSPGREAFAVTTVGQEALDMAAAPRLDDMLKAVPGVNLFRRTSSLVAHPTIQGVSLRGIGPNGAGRALVMLDGVPQNDPFGGWVYWSALPTSRIAGVDVIRGGGAGSWGNAALAGTVLLTSRAIDGSGAVFEGSYGNKNTLSLSGDVQADLGRVAVFAGGHYFSSDGFQTLSADQRGPLDQPLGSDAAVGRAGMRWQIDEITTAALKFSGFKENRNNGTPLAFNNTRSYDMSLRVVREAADGDGFEVTLYGTDRRFENQFSSVAGDRASEVPALYQYNVPSSALGGTAKLRRMLDLGGVLEAGLDFRRLKGATHEHYFFSGGAFVRDRNAGGDQIMTGGFVDYTTRPVPAIKLTGGVRLDYLRNYDGMRVERALDTGETLLDEHFAASDHLVVNGRVGAVYGMSDSFKLRGAAYSGFRLPTINELYRPFRVRSDITEANPALRPERLWGLEAGIRAKPVSSVSVEVTAFANWLNNGVANVLVTDQPGFNEELGVFVPAGGTLSQRRNLDRVRTLGLEATLTWTPDPAWSVELNYLLSDPKVTKATDQPALEGKRPPQTARHQGSVTVSWTPAGSPLSARATLYGSSREFDDGLNTRPIGGYVAADLYLGYRLTSQIQLYATAENLFDAQIETGNASNGLVTVGRPRLVSVGLKTAF